MCGLFGMTGPGILSTDIDILDELMLISSTRGIDGTGLATGIRNAKPIVARTSGDPYYWKFEHNKESTRLLSPINHWFLGHTRWRSCGALGMPGVQPYVFDRITGTHNGTIYSWDFESEGYASDSKKLIHLLNDNADNLVPFLETLTLADAYALVFYDRKTKTMYACHNGSRSLAYATNKKRNVMYWASELRFLHFALHRQDCDFWHFEPFKLYSWKPGEVHSNSIKGNHIEWLNWTDYRKPEIPIKQVGHGHGGNGSTLFGETEHDLLEIPWMRYSRDRQTGELIQEIREKQTEQQKGAKQLVIVH